jgi:hypothetical protein
LNFVPAILTIAAFLLCFPALLRAQGTPPMDPEQRIQLERENARRLAAQSETPGAWPASTIDSLKRVAKEQINKAIMTPAKPGLKQWAPLTPRQKFHTFLASTYAPQTFISAGFDAARAKSFSDNAAYARGASGFAQHYGVELATNETDVFFQKFLLPVVLRQDPRYFRNPDLPFFNRVAYSMSRVIITRTDRGHNTFNASLVLGAAASQAVADIYVPGHEQGLWPIGRRIAFDLAIDSGFNLLNEFWPELRRKFFHR